MDEQRFARMISETMPSGDGCGRLAREAVTFRCAACIEAGRRPYGLGVVYATTLGPLLRVDRHRMRRFSDGKPAGRTRVGLRWPLAEPFTPDVQAAWFAVCPKHGRRPLPPLADLADAARSRSVVSFDI